MNQKFVEGLEARRVLASVTLIAPTWDGGIGGWVQTDSDDITNRLGGPAAVANYTLTIAPDSNGNLLVQGVTHVPGTATPQTSANGDIVVILDYTSVSQNPSYPLSEVGALIANYMTTTPVDGVRWAELPIHEMDLSRSTGLMDAISFSLGQAGVWVDQETYMDPHPINSIGDANPTVYDNVAFADNYWRTSGQPEQGVEYNGEPVAGAYNQELPEVQALNDGYPDAHVAVAGYYTGTIDFSSITDNDGPVYIQWYGNTTDMPARDQTGFYYSAVVGGTRPLSGVWSASGGTGTRTATGEVGQQWPNVTDVSATTTGNIFSGQSIGIQYLQQDRGESSTVTFSLDSDQNPYNGVGASLGQDNRDASTSINTEQFTGNTYGIAPGTYWIVAKTEDAEGDYRFSYGKQVVITAPMQLATEAHAATSTVTGKSTILAANANDGLAGGDLKYTWSTLRMPAGAGAPTFSSNGTNAAQNARVTFAKDGTYVFRCTIVNSDGVTLTSDTQVVVTQTAATLHVAPHADQVKLRKKLMLQTTVLDQFGHTMRIQPRVTYSVGRGPGSINSSTGVFIATAKAGHALIDIESGDLSTDLSILVKA